MDCNQSNCITTTSATSAVVATNCGYATSSTGTYCLTALPTSGTVTSVTGSGSNWVGAATATNQYIDVTNANTNSSIPIVSGASSEKVQLDAVLKTATEAQIDKIKSKRIDVDELYVNGIKVDLRQIYTEGYLKGFSDGQLPNNRTETKVNYESGCGKLYDCIAPTYAWGGANFFVIASGISILVLAATVAMHWYKKDKRKDKKVGIE